MSAFSQRKLRVFLKSRGVGAVDMFHQTRFRAAVMFLMLATVIQYALMTDRRKSWRGKMWTVNHIRRKVLTYLRHWDV